MATALPGLPSLIDRMAPGNLRRGDCIETFVRQCERFFQTAGIKENVQGIMVKAFISNEMLEEYEKTDEQLKFQDRLREAFVEKTSVIDNWKEIINYRKGTESVDKFVQKIDKFVDKIWEFDGTKEDMRKLIILHCCDSREVQREVELRKTKSTEEVVEIMKSIEKLDKTTGSLNVVRSYRDMAAQGTQFRKPMEPTSYAQRPRSSFQRETRNVQREVPRGPETRKCWSCNKEGHLARVCPQRQAPRCFCCGKEGHVRRSCPIKCEFCGKSGHREHECFTKRARRQFSERRVYYDRRPSRNNRDGVNGIEEGYWGDRHAVGSMFEDDPEKERQYQIDEGERLYRENAHAYDQDRNPNVMPPHVGELVGAIC